MGGLWVGLEHRSFAHVLVGVERKLEKLADSAGKAKKFVQRFSIIWAIPAATPRTDLQIALVAQVGLTLRPNRHSSPMGLKFLPTPAQLQPTRKETQNCDKSSILRCETRNE